MSHWGATVITNLVTAVPVIGQSIAEFIYIIYNLDTLGIVNNNARKKKLNIPERYLKNIPNSFLSMLIGLIDGDGYILINNTGKDFINIKLVLNLHIRDLSLLEYIKSILKIGKISFYPKNNPQYCKYIINRTDLQEILFPLLIYHNLQFLTKIRIEQYNKARYIMENNITKFSNINNNDIKPYYKTLSSIDEYINLYYFKNWIVGFTIAEGSFFNKSNKDFCFSLKQRIDLLLFESIKVIFNTNVKIYNEKNKYMQLILTSKKDIQEVINFFSYSGNHPLVGYKLLQYQKWLANLKISKRYSDLKI